MLRNRMLMQNSQHGALHYVMHCASGFITVLNEMKSSGAAVRDITIAYEDYTTGCALVGRVFSGKFPKSIHLCPSIR